MLPQKVKKGRKNCSILAPAGKFRHALNLAPACPSGAGGSSFGVNGAVQTAKPAFAGLEHFVRC
jgi:hypothetical protein